MSNVQVIRPEEATTKPQQFASTIERIYYEWDKALSRDNANALLELYATDGVIESLLIPHLLGKKQGVCRGREEMRSFFEALAVPHFKLVVAGGNAGSAIAQVARERDADLVVMAWHGHWDHQSCATRVVVRSSGCPVLLVYSADGTDSGA
jgi:nucleotide-binding universal stress UspA family protein